jgi:hypothetical protein
MIIPVLFLPAFLNFGLISDFSGVVVVISEKSSTVIDRLDGV